MGLLTKAEAWRDTLDRIPSSMRPSPLAKRHPDPAAMDSNVEQLHTDEQIKARLRELNNKMVQLDAEKDRTRQEQLRLQKALIEGACEYMTGWRITIEPPADITKGHGE